MESLNAYDGCLYLFVSDGHPFSRVSRFSRMKRGDEMKTRVLAVVQSAIFLSAFCLLANSAMAQGASTPKAQPKKDSKEVCEPPLGPMRFGEKPDAQTSERMKALFDADQSSRRVMMNQKELWPKLEEEDRARRVEVMKYLENGKLAAADDFYYAALIFQHGNCADHFKLSNQLAEKSMSLGNHDARWLYAASLDRYLMTLGKPQKFGTQYVKNKESGRWELYTVDPATTDEERAHYDVPPLAETRKQLDEMNRKPPR